jgi:hypothetical protein
VSVQRPAWSPDGSAILAVALQPGANQSELLEYTSARPNSTRPSDWRSQGLVTDSMHGSGRGEGVLSAAWAPNGKSVAIAANWGAADPRFFHVFLAPTSAGVLSRPEPVVPQIRACAVAWRSDSAELAVMQADDCGLGIGAILRVNPISSASQVPLRQLRARDPTWQYISLSGR